MGRAIWQEKHTKGITIGQKKMKQSLYTDKVYVESLIVVTKLQELNTDLRNIIQYKIDIEKSDKQSFNDFFRYIIYNYTKM